MEKTIDINIAKNSVQFFCSDRDTRNGFAHDVVMVMDGFRICEHTIHYVNRTWEKYDFQSVCKESCDKVIAERIESLKQDFRIKNKVYRITGSRKEEFKKWVDKDFYVNMIKNVKRNLIENSY